MDDKILKDRIPESELSNEFKRDGETLYGGDLNRMVTVTKGGINYNAKLFESYLYGDDYRPFYHGNEVDWQTKDEYIDYGIVYWVRSVLDVLTGLPYVYVTKMEYNGTSESWVEKEIIKFIDTEHLNEVLEDYLKKSGGEMYGNLDMGGYDITNVDYLRACQVRVDELIAERAVGGLTVENFLGVEGNANVTGSVRTDKAITKEIVLLSSSGQEEANIKLDENGNIDFNGKTVVNIELPEVDDKLSGKLDKVSTPSETHQSYIKNSDGTQGMLDLSATLKQYAIPYRNDRATFEVGDAESISEPVTLGQLNDKLETKVDKVEGKQLSDENFTSAEKSKLAGLESSRFVGQFVSLQALKAAYPTAPIGSYAYVDEGSGKNTVKYVWDSSDSTWVSGIPSTAELTPAMVKQLYEENDDTNAYTDAEKGKVALIDSKLDKVTTTTAKNQVYYKQFTGGQDMINIGGGAHEIVQRSGTGTIDSPNVTEPNHLVPLGQADGRYAVKSVEETKQDKLVSGVNIKTLGGQSLLGSGNIPIPSTEEFASKRELAPYISSKNLAVPDLKGKEYLGDGWYRLYNDNGITIDYNTTTTSYNINGESSITFAFLIYFDTTHLPYTLSHYSVMGSNSNNNYQTISVYNSKGEGLRSGALFNGSFVIDEPSASSYGIYIGANDTFDNCTFKLQLEKGTVATPFAVPAGAIPYIPEVKSEFDSKLDKVSTTSTFNQTYVKLANGTQSLIDIADVPIANTIARRHSEGRLEVGHAFSDYDAIPKGQADGRYAKSDWTLIATNASSTNDVINLPSGIKEILIIAGSGYTTVHLPNISEAAGVTIELFNGSNVHKGASWRINGNTVVKTWSGSGTTPNNAIYEIYGR